MPRSSSKKPMFEPLTEVQREWLRTQAARKRRSTITKPVASVAPTPLYSIMQENTLHNTSTDWRAYPEVLVKARALMVEGLRGVGVKDELLLSAMGRLPRHIFVDEAFYLRAYHDDALPIGHGQTISHPSTVARMTALLRTSGRLERVLEIGTGCGYQVAVLSLCAREVFSIERIAPLYNLAAFNLNQVSSILPRLPRLRFGDGMLGWPEVAPFDGILFAAAGLAIPQAVLEQLCIGGVLVAPVVLSCSSEQQHLVRITRTAMKEWQREILDAVRFVPLLDGVQS